jgi:hypothetical protein
MAPSVHQESGRCLADEEETWLVVRNASDPLIDDANLTVLAQGDEAARIYKKYGYWTSVNSAIAVWAVIAGRQ